MDNTFIIPCIRDDLIERCLETLYTYTEPNFYVFVIDQTPGGLDINLRNRFPNLMLIRTPITTTHTKGNLGFAMATNLGIRLAQTPYMTLCNDDVEFINKKWWQGVMDTFALVETQTPERPAAIVNPASIKLPDWSIGLADGVGHHILPYAKDYTEADWDQLVGESHYINKHLTINPGSVIDGINLYCSVVHTKRFLDAGLLDERYYPGGAEDYDTCCRLSMRGYRSVGTTLSWVYHHWSKTFKTFQDQKVVKQMIDEPLRFGDHQSMWGPRFDLWGVQCSRCDSRMLTKDNKLAFCPKHPEEVFAIPAQTVMPL